MAKHAFIHAIECEGLLWFGEIYIRVLVVYKCWIHLQLQHTCIVVIVKLRCMPTRKTIRLLFTRGQAG